MIAPAASPPSTGPPKPKERDYLSFSAIRTYQSCPLRYFFRYVAGLPDETVSASLVFGSAIHAAIEHHFNELMSGAGEPPLKELLDRYQHAWDERVEQRVQFGKDDRVTLDLLAHRMLSAFRESESAIPNGRILAVEEELRGQLLPGVPDLLARVDLIVELPHALVISDWKTSRSRWSQEQIDESAEQLLLYSELVRDFAPPKPIKVEFAVLTKTKEVNVDRHLVDVDRLQVARIKRVVERVWRAIESENFYPAPSPMACGGCPFRQPCRRWPG
jgi:putative RecB family exonuclease